MTKYISISLAITLMIIAGAIGWIVSNSPANSLNDEKAVPLEKNTGPKNATYNIEGKAVTLIDGVAQTEVASGSASKVTTRYFGNEVQIDLNDDGREDVVFLITQNTGGSGTFFYVVAALNTEAGWVGSDGFYLGDRIAPQTTEISQNPNHQKVIVVNYTDRVEDQPFTETPTIGKSVWLKLDPSSMTLGIVEQNFAGEADPTKMKLNMHPWTWVKTIYNNDTQLTPNETVAFTLTFKDDGSVAINTDCNSVSGLYTVNDSNIVFSDMLSTLMYCEDSQEQDFTAMLNEIQSFHFTSHGELIFDLKYDSGSAIFR